MAFQSNTKHESCKTPQRTKDQPYDVLIIGAGILGCAAAVALAQQGRSILLLERSLKEPNRIVGELLQPGGVTALETLGMGECLEGIDAIPVKGYEIYYRDENITFWYPPTELKTGCKPQDQDSQISEHREKEDKLGGSANSTSTKRPEGRSFHHGKFIMKLRKRAEAEENVTILETTAKEILKDGKSGQAIGVMCSKEKKEDQNYFAHLIIVADGQASNFRSHCIKHTPIAKSKFWGLELIDADLPSYGLAYGIIGNGPPVLIYQIGLRETRILIDIPNGVQEATSSTGGIKNYIQTQVIPTLPSSVQPMVEIALTQGSLRSMPNSWLPPSTNRMAGMIILGDALNMRHPLTGGGMTVALSDVVLISELLSPQAIPSFTDTGLILKQMQKFHWRRKEFSTSLNILAQALYSLFVADDPQLQVLQRGFVRYIQRGGDCVEQPAGLMGGVIRSPFLLFYHFFAVALYSLWILLIERCALSVWYLPGATFECGRVFFKAVGVILPFILSELWS